MTADIDALVAEARKRATAKWKGMEGSTNHLVNRLADALESVYADSLTAQAEHARWQERAEKAERAGERILADALARSAELRKERERADEVPEPQGEPTDAQVEAARLAYQEAFEADYDAEDCIAFALRAALDKEGNDDDH